jgi:hypothetical protein
MTRDGDWTMIANKATSTRPAPQQSGSEEDLLPAWLPATQNARATYTVYDEWTLSQAGWVEQYGADILAQNLGAQHVIQLSINGTVKDTFTAVPNTSGLYWQNITPIIALVGAVIRVTLTVTQVGNQYMYWYQQAGLFATAPTYCSLAVGSKDGAAAGTTAYGCHVMFAPGTASPDWDVVAYSGAPGGGGGAAITFAGDLSGTSITQTVVGLQGKPLDSVTMGAPANGNLMVFDIASGQWKAAPPSSAGQVSADWQSVTAPTNILNRPSIWTDNQAWPSFRVSSAQGAADNLTITGSATGNPVISSNANVAVTSPLTLNSAAVTGGQIQFGSPLANVYSSIISGVPGVNGPIYITMGCYYNVGSSSWIPTLTTAATLYIGGAGALQFTSNPGVIVNTAFTPTTVFSVNNVGTATFTGSTRSLVITPGNTTYGSSPAISSSTGTVILNGIFTVNGNALHVVGTSGLNVWSPDNTRDLQISCANGGNPLVSSSTGVLNCSVAWTVSSDYRLKENVEVINDALLRIMQLRPIRFNWRNTVDDAPYPSDGRRHMGFIAHEVKAVLPDVVVGEKDAVTENGKVLPQGMTDTELIALLCKAVQELSAKVTALENAAHA